MDRLKIIPTKHFKQYQTEQKLTLTKHFNKIKKANIDFGFVRTAAVVYSSMIEGNPIDLDTYYRFHTSGMNTKTKSFREIQDLEKAYSFAQKSRINEINLLTAHKMLSKTFPAQNKYKGAYRDKNVSVMAGKTVLYTGAKPEKVITEMKKLFADIDILQKRKLTLSQTFYYAAYIHLVFVAVHPFSDGNGRAARLLEKWFLVSKLGENAWSINSEKLYMRRNKSYHANINRIGSDYETLNYDYSLPFLKMLPMALRIK